jgi:hypothetical protein
MFIALAVLFLLGRSVAAQYFLSVPQPVSLLTERDIWFGLAAINISLLWSESKELNSVWAQERPCG